MTEFDRQERSKFAPSRQVSSEESQSRDKQPEGRTPQTKSPWSALSGSTVQDSANSTPPERSLGSVIEADVIPRLLMAHQAAEAAAQPANAELKKGFPTVRSDGDVSPDVARLASLAVRASQSVCRAHVDSLLARGMTTEELLSDVFGPTARYLGWLWETDATSFVEVTFGLSSLQQLLRIYGPTLVLDGVPDGGGQTMLLTVTPGAQHTFGLAVVEEYFRGAGWDVRMETPRNNSDLITVVGTEWLDVVGISVATEGAIEPVRALLPMIRAASLNRNIRIVVGGAAISCAPQDSLNMAADAIVQDGQDALKHLKLLLEDLVKMSRSAHS